MQARYLASAPLALLLMACGGAADPEAVTSTIRATEEAQFDAISSRDQRGAVRNYYTDAVRVMPGSAPVAGGDAIGQSLAALMADPSLTYEIEPGPSWVAASGDLAATTATVRLTTTDAASGEPVTTTLANQTLWHRAEGERWRIVTDYNVPLAPAE